MHRNITLAWIAVPAFLLALNALAQTPVQQHVAPPVARVDSAEGKSAAPHESPFPDDYDVIESAKWRTVKLSMDLSHGGTCEITLARPLPWLDLTGAKVGGTIDRQMPEMGIAGSAKVVAIEACPEFSPPKPGSRPVIGKFVTTNAKVIELSIDGMDKPIGTTASHPFWSLDRKGWIAAGDLKPGEKLRTLDGSATVKSVVPRPGTETVYNIEVHKDHTFFVTDAKLWVHNNCPFISDKIRRQMTSRGWTDDTIAEAIASGQRVRAVNKANGNPATRYIHSANGQSVVVDDVANEVIHVGGPGFQYGPGSGDLP